MSKEKLKILHVEDNPTDAFIVKKKLQKDNMFDYEITNVVTGEDALSRNQTYCPFEAFF